jgi:hypothetical protein
MSSFGDLFLFLLRKTLKLLFGEFFTAEMVTFVAFFEK